MSTAFEPDGADARKHQRHAEGGFVEALGKQIIVQARELDEASSMKYGCLKNSGTEICHWISKVQRSAGHSVYVVSISKNNGDTRRKLTFGDSSNAIECFMTATRTNTRIQATIFAFQGEWAFDEAVPVMQLMCGTKNTDFDDASLFERLEKLKATQIAQLTRLLEDTVTNEPEEAG